MLVEWSHLTDRLDKDSAVPVGQNGHDAPRHVFSFCGERIAFPSIAVISLAKRTVKDISVAAIAQS